MEEIKTHNGNFNPADFSDDMVADILAEVGAPADTPAPAKPRGKKTVREAGKKVEEKAEGNEIYFLVNGADVVIETDANRAAAQAILNSDLILYRGERITPSVSFQ